ncbi:MAG TPA: cation diffusion facilitator family transporter [Ktedonobacterales bacterium]
MGALNDSARLGASHLDTREQRHSHDHGHHDHTHGVRPGADRRYLVIVLALLLGFMVLEVVLGFLASSLALLSDAGHMLTDVGALVMALVAMRLAARPATERHTFGLKRAEILSAQINGITLLVLAALFVFEAIQRLITPPRVAGGLVLAVALVGIAVNLAATWTLARANRQSLNVEGSYQHILTDLYAFIATAIAGALIWLTGLVRLDAIAALVVAALMAKAGIGLVRDSWTILLEATPTGVNLEAIARTLTKTPGIEGLHDLHVWEVTSGFPVLSAHMEVADRLSATQRNALLDQVSRELHERFGIHHTTIQLECARCGADGLYCALPDRPADSARDDKPRRAARAG